MEEAVKGISNSDISSVLSFMQIADLKQILQKNLIEGGVNADISYENGIDENRNPSRKMIITLEAPDDGEWMKIFEIESNDTNNNTVEEFTNIISQILTEADISEAEFYINLDDFFKTHYLYTSKDFLIFPSKVRSLYKTETV